MLDKLHQSVRDSLSPEDVNSKFIYYLELSVLFLWWSYSQPVMQNAPVDWKARMGDYLGVYNEVVDVKQQIFL